MPVMELMLTPAGAMVEFGPISDHVTGTDAVMGAMLKFPIALNWTMPEGKFMAFADMGVTVMLCNWRPMDMVPPQETVMTRTAETIRKKARAENLRIDTSNQVPWKGKVQRKGEGVALKYATPAIGRKKSYSQVVGQCRTETKL